MARKMLSHLDQVAKAADGALTKAAAESLADAARDLADQLTLLVDDLETYANAERGEVADAREQLESTAGDTRSELAAFGLAAPDPES